ncbi:MAG: TrmH family RNA methyltransferase [bacterium]|nr:TrmH family RNA methyltransferase [bacterium]
MEIAVILHNIRSLHNVGSIFRTADAAAVEKIYLSGITPAPVDRFGGDRQQMTKVSLGAEKTMNWEKIKSISKLLDRLKKDGYKIFAIEQDKNSISYHKLSATHRTDKIVLILGNEVGGITKTILKKCDKILEIPMRGSKESLNVAVSFGIVIFSIIYD